MSQFSNDVYYWRAVYEVDFVLYLKNKILPIEVKYRNKMDARDLKGLMSFMEKFAVNRGIVVTKNTLKREIMNGRVIDYIPAWMFLSVC